MKLTFPEFIKTICSKPGLFTPGSVVETLAFIDGYRFATETPISDGLFDRYVCIRNSFPSNYVWSHVIKACTNKPEEAFKLIEETILEFVRLRETLSEEALLQFAQQAQVKEEEAEKVFLQFDKALLYGDRSMIEDCIEQHDQASVLWEGSYPTDIAEQLYEISVSQPVRSIPLSESGDLVKIIAQAWPFPIIMTFKNNSWKIDASDIIHMRLKTGN